MKRPDSYADSLLVSKGSRTSYTITLDWTLFILTVPVVMTAGFGLVRRPSEQLGRDGLLGVGSFEDMLGQGVDGAGFGVSVKVGRRKGWTFSRILLIWDAWECKQDTGSQRHVFV